MKKQLLFLITALLVSWSAQAQMELTFNTNLSPGTTITLPLGGNVDVRVDWGDGNYDDYTTAGDKTHTYVEDDEYYLEITGTLDHFGSNLTGFDFSKLKGVLSFGDLGLKSLSGAFSGALNLVEIPYSLPTTVTDLSSAFAGATIFNSNNLTYWDVSNVTSMGAMFENATSFNQNISTWNVSNVTDMMAMFKGATSFDQNISTWNISKVYDMAYMFEGVTLSTENYDKLLIGWSVQAVVEEIEFDGGNSRYSPGEAANARAVLTDLHAWIITDGGNSSFTRIPDANFLQALIDLGYDAGIMGNDIPTANLDTITALDVIGKNISDLTGIADFVALEVLMCDDNNLSVLDVSKNTALTLLWCDKNQLESLDVSKNTELIEFWCQNNLLTYLDVSKNTKLTQLGCPSNELSSLDVSKNIALISLFCATNQLTTLDVSENTVLRSFRCNGNDLSVLDVSENKDLVFLFCNDNDLTILDIRNGYNANIGEIDATNNPNLTCIYVDDKTADLSFWLKDATATFANNEAECNGSGTFTYVPDDNFEQALIDLGYDTGSLDDYVPTANISGIKELDVSVRNISDLTGIQDFADLVLLFCYYNQLDSLDVSKNKFLELFDCSNNNLTSLDVSKNTVLTGLAFTDNPLSVVDISKNIELEMLYCGNCEISTLDVSKNPGLEILSCWANEISSLDVSKNPALTYLDCSYNLLTSLNNRNGNNANVTDFDATNNPYLTCIYVDDKTADLSTWEKDETSHFVNNEAECDAITTIADITNQAVSIYPNPTHGIVNFDFEGAHVQKMKIVDIAGETVFEKANVNQTEILDISGFGNGLYIVILQTDNGSKSFKIIKQ